MPQCASQASRTTTLSRPCAVCNGRLGDVLGSLCYASLDGAQLASRFDVVGCSTCGLVTGNTKSSQADYDRFYATYAYSPASLAAGVSPGEEEYFRSVAATVAPYLERGCGGVLDVGCGSGKLLGALRARGFDRLGAVDLSAACVESLRTAGFDAEVGSAAQIPSGIQPPSVIVLGHILEHVVALRESLLSIRRHLAPAGVVYVEVPDTSLFQEYSEESPLKYFYPQHLCHLDRQHLNNVFAASGFELRDQGSRVRAEGELQIPSIWAVYEPSGGSAEWEPCGRLSAQIRSWFEPNLLDAAGTFARLRDSGCRVFVWGVGIHVELMLGMSPLAECNIVCCVDQNPRLHGRRIGRHRIDSTDELRAATAEDVVVIGSRIHRVQMLESLRRDFEFEGQVVTI